ncbi:XRE family transcriptional regulator [Gammaproteobacteria bacterium SCGC AG-212-F23]|nr:XRE family transcriptional regulator [Gammaproteobacteria bacterium SCGC AG-212-F23]
MLMHNPPHPGIVVKRMLIEGAGLSVTDAAKALGVGRVTLSKLFNKKSGISPEMAVRLSLALNTSSEMWINMQSMYDLWDAEKKRKQLRIKIRKIKIHQIAA